MVDVARGGASRQAYLLNCQFEVARVVSMMLDRHLDLMLNRVLTPFKACVLSSLQEHGGNPSKMPRRFDPGAARLAFESGLSDWSRLATFDDNAADDEPTAADMYVGRDRCLLHCRWHRVTRVAAGW